MARKVAYHAGIRDKGRNKPLRQYRDPSLQIAYMLGRVEVREDYRPRGRAGRLIAAIWQHWHTILLYMVVSLLIGMLIAYIDPYVGYD